MNVVIVESPSKAKTIMKYLGNDYTVLASYGHIRDIPSKSGMVDPAQNFLMKWEETSGSGKNISAIKSALKGAKHLYLATDPDREGEAISWHVYHVLEESGLLKNIDVKRVVFYEVTKKAVLEAIKNPRELNTALIDAYLARRALDYLVGFNLSPVLWQKLPGSKSAGRVQSVALRLIADREGEIERFKTEEYWSITGVFEGDGARKLPTKLTHFEGKKLEKFSITKEAEANRIIDEIKKNTFGIKSVEKKQVKRNPTAPFITSTLQQEASRKLGFSARKTMQLAQKLYEGINLDGETKGLITYMRTDSVILSVDALSAIRDLINTKYGAKYLPSAPRTYKSSAKNAQEAHEAIRPTDMSLDPKSIVTYLEADLLKLYTLVWQRTIASQMESALIDQVAIDMANSNAAIIFRATGSTIAFDGFLKVYEESTDDEADEENAILPAVKLGEAFDLKTLNGNQHFTQPPPRFTEASLVKKLEELGIGRPSTYASILSTLIERKYVHMEKKQMVPDPLGRLVTAFLQHFFKQYVEYDFTAKLEQQLDDVSDGNSSKDAVLQKFWEGFTATIAESKNLKISDVIDRLNEALSYFIFSGDEAEKKKCPKCTDGQLSLKFGKFGSFVGCSNYPTCTFTRQLTNASDEEEKATIVVFEPKRIGNDPKTGLSIILKKGPYGFYLQWGEDTPVADKKTIKEKGKAKEKAPPKPKRAPVPASLSPDDVTLEQALLWGALPRVVGVEPESGIEIVANIGRFGPYLKFNDQFISVKKDYDIYTLSLDDALIIIEASKNKEKKKFSPQKATSKEAPKAASKPVVKPTAKAASKSTQKKGKQ